MCNRYSLQYPDESECERSEPKKIKQAESAQLGKKPSIKFLDN